MHYLELLERLHTALRPRAYLEIGVDHGDSLALSRAPSVAIDPAARPRPSALEGKPWVKVYQQTSDDFFRTHTSDVLQGQPLDLAYIDGFHEFAQVVRDLENIEGWSHDETVVVIHDVLPGDAWVAARTFHEGGWTGDVWRIEPFLREHRPDLGLFLIQAAPSGVLVVTNLDSNHPGMAEAAAELDAALPPDGAEYEALVHEYVVTVTPLPPEALGEIPALTRSIPHLVQSSGWFALPGTGVMHPATRAEPQPLRLVFSEPAVLGYRIDLSLTASGMPVLGLVLRSAENGVVRERRAFLDVARPGALHHELDRVGLYEQSSLGYFELELEGSLDPEESLLDLALVPMNLDFEPVPATGDMAIGVLRAHAEQVAWPRSGVRFLPERIPERPMAQKRRNGRRDAVVFSWFVPNWMPALGEYYLGLLRFYHADSKLFIGMNHGSDPTWEGAIRASGLDVDVRWARDDVGDSWDATGFLTALEAFHRSEEAFDLAWFGHTKGGSGALHTDYDRNRLQLQRHFWSRRAEVDEIFADPRIGVFARRFTPWWDGHAGDELLALQRVYRDEFAPLGLCAFDTFFVMRADIVRRFCGAVPGDFFLTPPVAYGANRWFFEMAFPSVASMQGFEPSIDPEAPGGNDPRDDAWLRDDPKQNHRLAQRELDRWRRDPVAYEPTRIRQIWKR